MYTNYTILGNFCQVFYYPNAIANATAALSAATLANAVVATVVLFVPAACVVAVVAVLIVPFKSPLNVVAVAVPDTVMSLEVQLLQYCQ